MTLPKIELRPQMRMPRLRAGISAIAICFVSPLFAAGCASAPTGEGYGYAACSARADGVRVGPRGEICRYKRGSEITKKSSE